MDEGEGFVDWMFRSRETGRITVAQFPNWPLAVWFVASIPLWLGVPQGLLRSFLAVVAPVALAVWAADELLRGVNPFRRMLGATMLAWIAYSLWSGS